MPGYAHLQPDAYSKIRDSWGRHASDRVMTVDPVRLSAVVLLYRLAVQQAYDMALVPAGNGRAGIIGVVSLVKDSIGCAEGEGMSCGQVGLSLIGGRGMGALISQGAKAAQKAWRDGSSSVFAGIQIGTNLCELGISTQLIPCEPN
jgi:hypothetical protein